MKISNLFKLITKFIAVENLIEVSVEESVPLKKEKTVNAICFCESASTISLPKNKMENPSKTSESSSPPKIPICSVHDNQTCANYLQNVLNTIFKKKITDNQNTNYFFHIKKNVKIYECKNYIVLFFPFENSQKRFSRFLVYVILKNTSWNLSKLWSELYSKDTLSLMKIYDISKVKHVEVFIPIPESISLVNKYELKNLKVQKGKICLRNNVESENCFSIFKKKIVDFFWPAEKKMKVLTPYLAFICDQKNENKIQMFFMDDNENLMKVKNFKQ